MLKVTKPIIAAAAAAAVPTTTKPWECLIAWFFLLQKKDYLSPSSYGGYKIQNGSIIKFKESASSNSNTTMIEPFHINKFKLDKSRREREAFTAPLLY